MMDCFMVGTLLAGFGLVWMLVNWCQRQVGACGMASFISTKGAPSMMDCFMVGTLLAGFGLVWMLVNWCQRQVDSQE